MTTSAVTSTRTQSNYLHPYASSSLWSCRPVEPVFGTFVIPPSSYFPSIASGAYSTGVFLAEATDKPMTIVGTNSTESTIVGVADPDISGSRVITIPRWPASVFPAEGTDGHADIVDPINNIVHSFWKLKNINGRWTASLYSWSKLDGTGWGDPAHYYQGARAAGVPSSAGLIRKHEINDGLPTYTHALTMSLTFNALSNGVAKPAYIFPATSSDNSLGNNTGEIPEGALMMLPQSFDSSKITNLDLKKIVETLKTYGAYVVDRNVGTPFTITVENGVPYNLMPKGWDNTVAGQLDNIRSALRQVVDAKDWIDADGNSIAKQLQAQRSMSILSLRGGWYRQMGDATATFDSLSQTLIFKGATRSVFANGNNTGLTPVKWAIPPAGTPMMFSVVATGGASLRLQVTSPGLPTYDTGAVSDGQHVSFTWPASARIVLSASTGSSGNASLKVSLVPVGSVV